VLDALCRALSDPGAGQFAALALGRLGDVKAVPALTTMCRSIRGQGQLIHWPVYALARIGGTAAADAFADLFRHEDVAGRSVIAGAMADVAVPGVVGPLVAAGADESWTVRVAAREALRKLPHPILVEGLAGALVTADSMARGEAARLAPYHADERICRLLAELASHEPDSEVAAAARQAEEVYKLRTSNNWLEQV
jgi:HEAT repeat protein